MYYIKCLPPDLKGGSWNYTRWGYSIPKNEIQIESLKDYFKNLTLDDLSIYEILKKDSRIVIETDKEKSGRIEKEKIELKNTDSFKFEQKTDKEVKRKTLEKKIDKFNNEKEAAQITETLEDDKIVLEKEKELEKEIKEVTDAIK